MNNFNTFNLPTRKIILFLVIFSSISHLSSQIIFQKKLPYSSQQGHSATNDIQITNDGGYVLLRNDIDYSLNRSYIRLIKTNFQGNIEWTSNYHLDLTGSLNNSLFGYAVKQTNDSGYIIIGSCSILDGDPDVLLIKTDSGGNMIWNTYYSSQVSLERDCGKDVIQTNDGGYLITGVKNSNTTPKLWLIKTNSAGIVLWEKTLHPISVSVSEGYTVRETIDGNLFITGKSGSSYPFLIKLDLNGNTIWGRTYSYYIGNDSFLCGEPTKDGGYIISIEIVGTNSASLMKIKTNGDVSWFKKFNFYGSNKVQQTADNGYILCGESSNIGSGVKSGTLLKTDSLGNVSFLKTVSGLRSFFHSTKQTADHGYVIAGDQFINLNYEMLFLKTDSAGFSGCNDLSGNPIVVQYTITTTPEIITNVPSNSYNTGTVAINFFITNDTTTINLCALENLTEINKQNYIKAFPNPTNGQLIIQAGEKSKTGKIKLTNTIGETLLEKDYNPNEQTINISDQPNGIYILELNQQGSISRTKLIKY